MNPSHINRFFTGASDLTSVHFVDILSVLGIDLDKIVSDELQKLAGIDNSEITDLNSSVIYLLNSIDEIGRQTVLQNLLWSAQVSQQANGSVFPKNVENKIKREISLI